MTAHRVISAQAVSEYIVPILGGVDLDPCAHSSSPVEATQKCYGNDTDGCTTPWSGRVWLFPPSRREELGGHTLDQWVSKAYREYAQGATVLALLPNGTGSGWFHDFVVNSTAFTLVREPLGVDTTQPLRLDRPQITVLWTRDFAVAARYSQLSENIGLLVENT